MNPERSEHGERGMRTDRGADDCAQRLSCLLDGELDAADCQALLEQMRHDPQGWRKWSELSCVGDALRSSEVAAWHSDAFVGRVAAALEREPVVLAPAALKSPSGGRRWLLPGAGAAAAAVLLLAVGLPSRQDHSPAVAGAAPVAAPAAVAVVSGPLQIDRSPVLERYLAAHRELAEPTLMPYSTPYVRTSGALLLQETR
jgi:hypothetical protein